MAEDKVKAGAKKAEQKPAKKADKKLDKAAAKKTAAKNANKKPNVFRRMGRFFKELKSEVSKVVWLSPKQTANNTFTVLVIVVISAVFIAAIDIIFKTGVWLMGGNGPFGL